MVDVLTEVDRDDVGAFLGQSHSRARDERDLSRYPALSLSHKFSSEVR
jgi:hypothetical protein